MHNEFVYPQVLENPERFALYKRSLAKDFPACDTKQNVMSHEEANRCIDAIMERYDAKQQIPLGSIDPFENLTVENLGLEDDDDFIRDVTLRRLIDDVATWSGWKDKYVPEILSRQSLQQQQANFRSLKERAKDWTWGNEKAENEIKRCESLFNTGLRLEQQIPLSLEAARELEERGMGRPYHVEDRQARRTEKIPSEIWDKIASLVSYSPSD